MNSSRLQNYTIYYNNSDEYHQLKKEVFTTDSYYFESDNPDPFIIDVGAHIGLATLYFKKIYPKAKIIAIEPKSESFKLLETNIFENQVTGVTTVQTALSDQIGRETIYFDQTPEKWYSTTSFHKGSWSGTQKSSEAIVSTNILSEFITQKVDFLKLDAEGAEQKIIFASKESLPLVEEMHIEFHSHKSQSLPKLIEVLEQTHNIEIFKGTQIIALRKATGLVQIRACKK